MKVKELPESERPIFRLRYFGASSLSNQELIQLITGASDFETASEILSVSGGLPYLRKMTVEELSKVSGINFAVASRLIASAELGSRTMPERLCDLEHISESNDVWEMFQAEFSGEKQEIVTALLLNIKNGLIGREMISKGSIASACVEPRDVFRLAIKKSASSLILIHNHPSGDPTPSEDDIYSTKRISQCGELLNIKVLDHIIIGQGRYTSLRELGQMEFGDPPLAKVADARSKYREKERER